MLTGTRLENNDGRHIHRHEAGTYVLVDDPQRFSWLKEGEREVWFRDPTGALGRISSRIHTIMENADGTITVEPSILVYGPDGKSHRWHGYLRGGVWQSC